MNFKQFLSEQSVDINERFATGHGKVESAIRAAGLDYEKSVETSRTVFDLEKSDYFIYSYNNGSVDLMKQGVKGAIKSVDTSDYKDVIKKVSELLNEVK